MEFRQHFGAAVIRTRAELLDAGFSARGLTAAVRSNGLIRVRRGLYALPDTPASVLQSVRIGGRLSCVSALAAAGVWVFESRWVHLQLPRGASRPRSPASRFARLTADNRDGCELHWRALVAEHDALAHVVAPVDAVITAIRCQPPRFALASLESALITGYLPPSDLDVVFANVPRHLGHLRCLIDLRSGSGLETILRMILREAGIAAEIQVWIEGVGRVDFLVAGRIVIECDGAAFHGVAERPRDYDRDLVLEGLGYAVIRVNYRQVMFEEAKVVAAVRAAIRSHRYAAG